MKAFTGLEYGYNLWDIKKNINSALPSGWIAIFLFPSELINIFAISLQIKHELFSDIIIWNVWMQIEDDIQSQINLRY